MPPKDPFKKALYDRNYYRKHRTRIKKRVRAWGKQDRKQNPRKHKARHRIFNLKTLYRLTLEEFKKVENFEKETVPILLGKINGVDHDHSTKVIRGVLEYRLNRVLGMLEKLGKKRTPELLRTLANFLENPPAVQVLGKRKTP